MRRGEQNPIVSEKAPISQALAVMTRTPVGRGPPPW